MAWRCWQTGAVVVMGKIVCVFFFSLERIASHLRRYACSEKSIRL